MEKIFMQARVCEFSDETIEKKKLKAILKAGMAAPSAGNQQPWEFYIITEPTLKKKLADCSRYANPAENAPVVIVPCYQKRASHPKYLLQDMTACAENMLLEAAHLGIGTDLISIAPKENRIEMVRNAMNLPLNLDPFCIIAMGYPASGEIPMKPARYDADKIHFRVVDKSEEFE